jgi:hypothetical protein
MVRLKRTQLGTMNTEAAASERLIQHLDGKKQKKLMKIGQNVLDTYAGKQLS